MQAAAVAHITLSVTLQVHWSEPQHGGAESVHVSRCDGERTGTVVQLFSQVIVKNVSAIKFTVEMYSGGTLFCLPYTGIVCWH